jgi:CRP-like cAMP-binding protein
VGLGGWLYLQQGDGLMDGLISLNKVIVQLTGKAETLDVAHLREIADKSPEFRTTLVRQEQVLFAQAPQSAACIAAHTVEARLSRWLLRSRRRPPKIAWTGLCGAAII